MGRDKDQIVILPILVNFQELIDNEPIMNEIDIRKEFINKLMMAIRRVMTTTVDISDEDLLDDYIPEIVITNLHGNIVDFYAKCYDIIKEYTEHLYSNNVLGNNIYAEYYVHSISDSTITLITYHI